MDAGFEYEHISACITICDCSGSTTHDDVSVAVFQNPEEISLTTKICCMDQFYDGTSTFSKC